MKKLFLSLVVAIATATVSYSQRQVATLTHNGMITPYYGYNGLQNAHNAAMNGDVITLSSGNFGGITITKPIILRGAGMQTDTQNNILPTYIKGEVTLNIPEEETQALIVEGVQFMNGIKGNNTFLKNATFTKCITKGSFSNIKMQDVQFIQCKMETLYFNTGGSNNTFSVINCFVRSYSSNNSNGIFKNCIVGGLAENSGANTSFYNCILWGGELPSSSVAENCLGSFLFNSLKNGVGNSANVFRNIAQTTNRQIVVSSLFKTYSYTSSTPNENWENENFELTDEAKAAYHGDDDTEVGIYGGLMPFDPIPTHPRITKCNVAAKSTVDGKLSVDIEVTAAE